jgi:hypothetical protein
MNKKTPEPRETEAKRPEFSKFPWSDGIKFDYVTVQNTANCYCYACNDPEGHGAFGSGRPVPGQRAGIEADPCDIAIESVTRRAEADGLISAPSDNPPQVDGYYLVAMTRWEKGGDVHWYRQDADGTWSHKMGNKEPTQLDASGNLILDVKTADRGKYSEFGGFFYVPNEGIAVGKKGRFLLEREKNEKREQEKHHAQEPVKAEAKPFIKREKTFQDKESIPSTKPTRNTILMRLMREKANAK